MFVGRKAPAIGNKYRADVLRQTKIMGLVSVGIV